MKRRKIKNIILGTIFITLFFPSLFFFDANPTLWGLIFLLFYFVDRGTEFFKGGKQLKAFSLYVLAIMLLIPLVYFITPNKIIYLLIIIPLGYIPYYLYKKWH